MSSIKALMLLGTLMCVDALAFGGIQKQWPSVVVHDNITLQPEGWENPLVDDMIYNDDDVWILDSRDGHVNIHDYNTGLHIARGEVGGVCYVYPTEHTYEDGVMLRIALQNGRRSFNDVDIAYVQPISDATIKDSSFLPVEAVPYCDNGYQWAKIVGYIIRHGEAGTLDKDEGNKLYKRGVAGGCQAFCVVCGGSEQTRQEQQ